MTTTTTILRLPMAGAAVAPEAAGAQASSVLTARSAWATHEVTLDGAGVRGGDQCVVCRLPEPAPTLPILGLLVTMPAAVSGLSRAH